MIIIPKMLFLWFALKGKALGRLHLRKGAAHLESFFQLYN